jgi:DNA-binding NarL/FixJ family response regulator
MSVKRQALQLYLEGLGFRSIGRFLGVSHVSVQKQKRILLKDTTVYSGTFWQDLGENQNVTQKVLKC